MKNLFVGFVFSMLNYILAFCHWLLRERRFKDVSDRWCEFTDGYWHYSLEQKCGSMFAQLFVHFVPCDKLKLLISLPEQGQPDFLRAIDELRKCAWLQSLRYPIRSLVSQHDSAQEALVIWLDQQNRYGFNYVRYPKHKKMAMDRLQEFLDQNISPHFMLQELIEVMVSKPMPDFLMGVLVKDCLARLRQHPLDSVCRNDCLTKLLEFLATQNWDGFTELRRECVLIAHARAAILEQAEHVDALLAAASDANPWKKVDMRAMLGGAGVTVPKP